MTQQLYFTLDRDGEFRENLLSVDFTYYPQVGEIIDIGDYKYTVLKKEYFASEDNLVYVIEMND